MSLKTDLKDNKKVNNKINNKNSLLFILIPMILVVILLLGTYSFRKASISGKIFSAGDSKITLNNVKVLLNNSEILINNSDGTYNITGLKEGNYNLSFERKGYKNYTTHISILKGQNIESDAYLYQDTEEISSTSGGDFISLFENNDIGNGKYNLNKYIKNILIVNNKIYTNDGQSPKISIFDYGTGNLINNIELPIGLTPDKFSVSSLKNKLYTVMTNDNSIGVIDLKTDKYIDKTPLTNIRIKEFIINKDTNKGLILLENSDLFYFNTTNYSIDETGSTQKDLHTLKSLKANILSSMDTYLYKQDIYDLDSEPIKFNFNFKIERIVTTNSEKLYISSGKNLYLVDPETGNINKTIDTGLNIVNMKVSPQDDNIYISDNTEKIHIFDTKNDELLKDSITFKMPVKEVFFPE